MWCINYIVLSEERTSELEGPVIKNVARQRQLITQSPAIKRFTVAHIAARVTMTIRQALGSASICSF